MMAESVLREFSLYENGNGIALYDRNWFPFPQEVYERLKNLLAQYR